MTQAEANALADELRRRFGGDVEVERVGQNGRFRFAVVTQPFQQMTQLQRQDAVWAAVDQVLPRPLTLDISLILTFAPDELARAV